MPIDGGATHILQQSLTDGDLELYEGVLYVSNSGGILQGGGEGGTALGEGSVHAIPVEPPDLPFSIATNQPKPLQVAVDASGVYWGGGRPRPADRPS